MASIEGERLCLGNISVSYSALTFGSLAGVVAFPVTLAGLQRFVFKPLRFTSSMSVPLASSLLGAGAVCAGSALASLSVASVASLLTQHEMNAKDMYISTAGGVFVFKVFGGRFRSVLPSHLFRPGSFAASSLPARGTCYAQAHEKDAINLLGKQNGCHTCGRKSGDFVADHQPPNSLSIPGQAQRFYPQCRPCSNLQGSLLSRITGRSRRRLSSSQAVVTHCSTLRLYHLFLPVPLILPLLKGSTNTGADSDGSSHSSVQLGSVEHSGSSTAGVGRGTPKCHVGTQTDAVVPIGNRSGNEDDPDELPPIEAIPRKLYHCVKRYLGLFPGEVGQMYALFHVCLVLAAVSNLLT